MTDSFTRLILGLRMHQSTSLECHDDQVMDGNMLKASLNSLCWEGMVEVNISLFSKGLGESFNCCAA